MFKEFMNLKLKSTSTSVDALVEKVIDEDARQNGIEAKADLTGKRAEQLLRKENIKIKNIFKTKFGIEFLLAKQYPEQTIKNILTGYSLRFDEKSVFIVL